MTSNGPKKLKFLNRVAGENGVAIVVLDSESCEASASNNNSMCRSLYPSSEFGPSCAQFCGKAFEAVEKAGEPVVYECYAGLACTAVPVFDREKPYVAIVGRTFLKAENYRKATEKAITGEWHKFNQAEFFENILISGSEQHIQRAVDRLKKFAKRENKAAAEARVPEIVPAKSKGPTKEELQEVEILQLEPFEYTGDSTILTTPATDESYSAEFASRASEWRAVLNSLMSSTYREACLSILRYLQERYGPDSLIWFERRNGNLEPLVSIGPLRARLVKIGVDSENEKLRDAAKHGYSVILRERRNDEMAEHERRSLYVFPMTVGGDIRGAIGIESEQHPFEHQQVISRFAQAVASQLEILRLRDEVTKRDWLTQAVKRFNESLSTIDNDGFWLQVTQISAELLCAERASILVRNEKSNSLKAMAAIGSRIDLLSEPRVGDRVAGPVLDTGDPIIVSDITGAGIGAAPADWRYRTDSFISYPIRIGNRKLGVINFTDKAGPSGFDTRDLEILQAITPQIAVAMDRTTMKDRAGEYEQLSVTDALTGLLNRRYLEERLAEESLRSSRHGFAMSLLMLDVDHFKSYNDAFGHPAGDTALRIVADVLKDTLRGADVAARYGGEEFAVLLPQTSMAEAAQIAERLRQRIENARFPKREVTVSIGIAGSSSELNDPKELVAAADIALYEAKHEGRNRVQVFSGFNEALSDRVH